MPTTKQVVVFRNNYVGPEILGHLMVFETNEHGGSRMLFECKTLELAWKNNQRNISCVPAGYYMLAFEHSAKFNMHLWELRGVPGRSETKFHVANHYTDLEGCIAVGDMHVLDMNGDNIPDVRNSATTLERFHEAMGSDTQATIRVVGAA